MDDKPQAYIDGICYFYNEEYKVTPDVLIPRPDTERVVDKVIELTPKGGRILDLCTGSGCIAISVLNNRADCTATAADISESAIKIAKENAVINNVSDRIEFIRADLRDLSFGEYDGKFDVIVSNPPYIRTDVIDMLDSSVKNYEPLIALDGGSDGMDFYRIIIEKFTQSVKPGGYMIFEIGYDQSSTIRQLRECEIYKDYGGNDRVAVIKNNNYD